MRRYGEKKKKSGASSEPEPCRCGPLVVLVLTAKVLCNMSNTCSLGIRNYHGKLPPSTVCVARCEFTEFMADIDSVYCLEYDLIEGR